MPTRNADATWEGNLKEGKGKMRLGSGAYEGAYSFGTRFEGTPGSNPEELLGAAHAGCYSMALSGGLGRAGYEPQRVDTKAKVHLDKGEAVFSITRIELETLARVPGISEADFRRIAEETKTGCPVSRALASVPIELDARLER
jgi:osmotically inducible protein OsmC